jgi:hypothetical protein
MQLIISPLLCSLHSDIYHQNTTDPVWQVVQLMSLLAHTPMSTPVPEEETF